jgi:uncharacterized RDD family membrane protein YckC
MLPADPRPGSAETDAPLAPPAYASLPRRLAAVGYEALLLLAVLVAAGFIVAPWASPAPDVASTARVPVPGLPARTALFASLMAVGATYCCWFWTGGRRTLPMQTWRIRLLRTDGHPVTLRQALLRCLAFWIGPALSLAGYAALRPSGLGRYAFALVALNYAWALVDRDRQFLHDRIAGTRLVRA